MARPIQPVHLPLADHSALRAIVKKGTHKSRTITRANALLRMDAGGSASAVQVQAGISSTQYHRLKRRCLDGGLANALEEHPRSGQPPKVTTVVEARTASLACSEWPAGASRWTLSLLNENMVSLGYIDTISNEASRQV